MQKGTVDIFVPGLMRTIRKDWAWILVCGILGAVISIGINMQMPRKWTSEVALASEGSRTSAFSGSLSSLSSMMSDAYKFRATGDAIFPDRYPEVVSSTSFIAELIPIDNPYNLTGREWEMVEDFRKRVSCEVDQKTAVIKIKVTDTDAEKAAAMADSVMTHLKARITAYRTGKASRDLQFIDRLVAESKSKYDEQRKVYAEYCASHQEEELESELNKKRDMETDLQLMYDVYSTVVHQQQLAKQRVQNDVPAFTMMQRATVPVKPSSKGKVFALAVGLFLGVALRLVWVSRRYCRGVGDDEPEPLRKKVRRILPYAAAVVVAVGASLVVWHYVPKVYSAHTVVSDEFKVVDLAVGMDHRKAVLRDATNSADQGLNDIDKYVKILESDDFARRLSHVRLPGKGCTYGQYLGEKDTIEAIHDNLLYEASAKKNTVTVQFSDLDPIVACQMLDSATVFFRREIIAYGQGMERARYDAAEAMRIEALAKYAQTRRAYAQYADSHMDPQTEEDKSEKEALYKKMTSAADTYQKATETSVRHGALMHRVNEPFTILVNNTVPSKPSNHIFSYIFSFIFLALLAVKAVKLFAERRRERWNIDLGGLFSPWSITVGVWALIGVGLANSGDLLYPLSEQFYYSIAIWLGAFLPSSILAYNLVGAKRRPVMKGGVEINNLFFYGIIVVSAILSPLLLYQVYQTVLMFDTDDIANNVRILSVQGEGNGILAYTNVLSQSALLVCLWRYPRIKMWLVFVVVLLTLSFSVAMMEKGTVFMVFLCSIYVLYERGVVKLRSIITLASVLIVVFYFFNLMRSGEESDYSKNETLFDFIGMYIMSPAVAYGYVKPEIINQFGTNTFGTVYLFIDRVLPGVFTVHEKLQDFVWVPMPTNVYTIMQPFFRDFGYAGVGFFALLYGVVSGAVYSGARRGNTMALCFYTYIVHVLVLQFYQENVFLSMVFIIQLVFFVVLCTQNKYRFRLKRPEAEADRKNGDDDR